MERWQDHSVSLSIRQKTKITGLKIFVSGKQYRQRVEEIIAAADTVDLAVAFLGKGASDLIGPSKRVRVICNLESGATNPHVVRDLIDKEIQVRSLATLHAKVMIADHSALVGSANLSANGLGLEGTETARWEEAGMLVRDSKVLANARAWFSGLWEQAAKIGPEQLKKAELAWSRRRAGRPPNSAFSQKKGLFAHILEDKEFSKDRLYSLLPTAVMMI